MSFGVVLHGFEDQDLCCVSCTAVRANRVVLCVVYYHVGASVRCEKVQAWTGCTAALLGNGLLWTSRIKFGFFLLFQVNGRI